MRITNAYEGEPTLAARVVWARQRIGLSQAELSRRIGYKTNVSLYRIEHGITLDPGHEVLKALAKETGVTVAFLRDGDDSANAGPDDAWSNALREYLAGFGSDTPTAVRKSLERVPYETLMLAPTPGDVHLVRELIERGYRRRQSAQAPKHETR